MSMRLEREKNELQQKSMIQLMDGEKGIVLEGVKGRNKEVHYSSSWIHVEEQEKEDMPDFVSKWMDELGGEGWNDVMDDLSGFKDQYLSPLIWKKFSIKSKKIWTKRKKRRILPLRL